MSWTDENPGAGDPDSITRLANARDAKSAALQKTLTAIAAAQSQADSIEWAGEAHDAFAATLATVPPDVSFLISDLAAQATALHAYAAAVLGIQQAQAQLIDQRQRSEDAIAGYHRQLTHVVPLQTLDSAQQHRVVPSDTPDEAQHRALLWREIDAENATLSSVNARFAQLTDERRQADAACVAALGTPAVLGTLANFTPSKLADLTPEQLLTALAGLTPAELAIVMRENPGLSDEFWNNPPDPNAVAAWWASLSPTEKAVLIGGAAAIIGNLGGVPYASRILANRNQLKAAENNPNLTADQKATVDQIEKALKAGGKGGAPRGVIDLDLDAKPPLAAIAIGNMDTADKVTWAIPGMDTKASTSMTGWSKVAQNLYTAQHAVDGSSHAVVAWIGYKTPSLSVSTSDPGSHDSVFENNLAKAGATRLTSELEAFHDERTAGGQPAPYVAVVAHSYGTTTSAYALHDLDYKVNSATFVASAGIDDHVIPNAQALQVQSSGGHEQFYATQADRDVVATVGRDLDPGKIYVPVSPWQSVPLGADDHRTNPTESFGAIRFSSEGGLDGKTAYAGTDGHDTLGYNTLNPITATPGHGYFNVGTESLHDSALASTGHGADIPILTQPASPSLPVGVQ